jgi:hypothetical protein
MISGRDGMVSDSNIMIYIGDGISNRAVVISRRHRIIFSRDGLISVICGMISDRN